MNNTKYKDLREFISILEKKNNLKRISVEVDPILEITEIADRTIRKNGPALYFEKTKNSNMPLLCNLFGSTERVAMAMGKKKFSDLKKIGKILSFIKEPELPSNFRDFLKKIPHLKKILYMPLKKTKKAPCQEEIFQGKNIDLSKYPIMKCWPKDANRLINFGLTVTQGPNKKRQNLGIYRQQVIDKNKLIMRWLPQRGGALDFKEWCIRYPGINFPVSVILGADPATIISAVTPIPDNLSEYSFAGLLRGKKTEVVKCISNNLEVSARAEIVLEGYINPNETCSEGPHGDHTGYYNEIETFPVFTVTHITQRHNAIYHSTYTGKYPDEPSILSMSLNELFIPIIQKQFPEILDFYLPPEACSYRLAIVKIKKQYIGHAKQVMMGIWSYLKQFIYIKLIVICDEDIDIRSWENVIWSIVTRLDPKRDTICIQNTPIDYLDFASPISGLGSKMGFDATNKWKGETKRLWGNPIIQDSKIINYINDIWEKLKIFV